MLDEKDDCLLLMAVCVCSCLGIYVYLSFVCFTQLVNKNHTHSPTVK